MKRIVITTMAMAALLSHACVPVQAQQYRYTQVFPQQAPQQQTPLAEPEATRQVIVVPTVPQTSGRALPLQGQIAIPAQVTQSASEILEQLHAENRLPEQINPTIRVTESDSLNAATDGRQIVITSALWDRLQNNDQRAFVISHELAHVVLDHVGRTQARRIGLGILDALILRRYIPEGTLVDMAKNLGLNLYDLRTGRHYEFQADDLGIQLMSRAGYNPSAALDVFQTLQAATPGSRTPEFLRSHPITESRIRALVQKYQLTLN